MSDKYFQSRKKAMKEIGYNQSRYWKLKKLAFEKFMQSFAEYQKRSVETIC